MLERCARQFRGMLLQRCVARNVGVATKIITQIDLSGSGAGSYAAWAERQGVLPRRKADRSDVKQPRTALTNRSSATFSSRGSGSSRRNSKSASICQIRRQLGN